MNKEELIKFCAEFWQVEASIINEDLGLNDRDLPNNSSIRFYQFLATLESHFQVRVGDTSNIVTFGDLFKEVVDSV